MTGDRKDRDLGRFLHETFGPAVSLFLLCSHNRIRRFTNKAAISTRVSSHLSLVTCHVSKLKDMKDFEIRVAVPDDVDLLIELGLRTFNDTFAHLNSVEDMEAYISTAFTREQILSELADPLSTFLLAETNGRAIAYAKLHRGEAPDGVSPARAIELARLYVDKEMHGKGVAHKLMEEMLRLATAEAFTSIWLGVWEHNERAKAFYRKCGFRDAGTHIFQLGSDPQTDLLMVREV